MAADRKIPPKRNVRHYAIQPLSSPVNIQQARDLCPRCISGCTIFEISESMILKMDPVASKDEAEAMCLVAKSTSVPVPDVINAYAMEGVGFIVMKKTSGILFANCWDSLPDHLHCSILRQLRDHMAEWREVQGDVFGSVNGPPCDDIIFKHPWGRQSAVTALTNTRPYGQLVDEIDRRLAEEILSSGDDGEDERKIFTHGGLHPSNITFVEGDNITGIIDWGAAGYSVASMAA
ncbi:hypothetical protein BDV25DRAFT_129402 [Aspergillus avenaceus]|uniref:Aminoglycoside phosphotransferase domain-containing protein n=1 Tax=Aspergillus avenaceus TaxID=36643 RepID=A0A5N6TX45_ASPAV|nr:hypothetical protein BDV25DRAFT_129402 [Aspergillus avenaceus]